MAGAYYIYVPDRGYVAESELAAETAAKTRAASRRSNVSGFALGLVATCGVIGTLFTLAPSTATAEIEIADAQTLQAQAFLASDIESVDVTPFDAIELAAFTTTDRDSALLNAREQHCLAEAIYYEARSETTPGQKAVAEVILNRVESRVYPNTVCDVVYQGTERAKARRRKNCQFSFTCDGSMERHTPRGRHWEKAQNLAAIALDRGFKPLTQNATHYHTTAVNPVWAEHLQQTRQVGDHVFYQDLPFRRAKRTTSDTAVAAP